MTTTKRVHNFGAGPAALPLEVLEQVQAKVLGALANQDLPFDQLVQSLQPERDLSYNPLFQAMFVYQSGQRRRSLRAIS